MKVKIIGSLIVFTWVVLYNLSCKDRPTTANNKRHFKQFDLLKLVGLEELKSRFPETAVEVTYSDNFPTEIIFHTSSKRKVVLTFVDSFVDITKRSVLRYRTSNFHGGVAGKHRVYGTHNEEYEDLIYINRQDTIICKSYQLPNSDHPDYALYLYFRNREMQVEEYQSAGNTDRDRDKSMSELYSGWIASLTEAYKEYKLPRTLLPQLPP
jgi:hypothetical protein